ncbi:response regulator [Candidatus Hydrogenedentota bacterium]
MKDITVLFVDDDNDILNALDRRLRKESYKRIFKNSAESALTAFEDESIQIVITDILMPGVDGLTLLRTVRESYPDTVRIVLSGQAQLSNVVDSINRGEVFRYVVKPLQDSACELARVIQDGIDFYLMHQARTELIGRLKEKNWELEISLAQIKRLEGLLPICALCKKIRDDKGYWQQVEVYVRDHSEADFSHGICPDCFKKTYPELAVGHKRAGGQADP